MSTPTLQGLEGRFIHKVAAKNQLPNTGGGQDNVVWLQIDPGGVQRTSSITLPEIAVDGVLSSEMEWDPIAQVAASSNFGAWQTLQVANEHPYWGRVTTAHHLVRQINQRQGLGAGDSDPIVVKCSLLDQLGASVWDYFPPRPPLRPRPTSRCSSTTTATGSSSPVPSDSRSAPRTLLCLGSTVAASWSV